MSFNMDTIKALNEAFCLDAEYVKGNPSDWGRLMYVVKEASGAMWMYKQTNNLYPRASTEGSCGCDIAEFDDVLRQRFRKTSTGDYTLSEAGGVWVCMPYHPETADLAHCSAPVETRRCLLAKTLGALHASSHANLLAPSFEQPPQPWCRLDANGVWSWIGDTASRVMKPLGQAHTEELRDVLEAIRDEHGSAIDALPKYPSTGDIQLKNVLCNVGGIFDHTALVNSETLIPMSRMWDVVWLFILTDDCTGVSGSGFVNNTEPETWASDLAYALAIYQEYCGTVFAEDEVLLFHCMLQVKVAQVVCVFPDLGILKEVFWAVDRKKDVIRDVLKCSAKNRCPRPVPYTLEVADVDHTPYEHVAGRLDAEDLVGKSPLLLHYNGTFMPIHKGHLATAVSAAKRAESAFNGKVVGVMFSLCHPDRASRKAKGAQEFVARRALLLHMALHSMEEEAVALREFNPFVDTYEMFNCHPRDNRRIKVSCNRFKHMTKGKGLVVMVAGVDTEGAELPWISDYLDVDNCVRAVLSLRVRMQEPPSTAFGILPTQFHKQSKVATFEEVTEHSSTDARSRPGVNTTGIFAVGCCIRKLQTA